MKRHVIILILAYHVASTLCSVAVADEEIANRPVVRSSEQGVVYAKSVPDAGYGQSGTTRVYSVAKDRDELTCEYDWYANEIYIGGAGDGTLVRFGPWHRGHEPQESHLAVGIYRNGKSIREYTTLEIQRLGSGFSKSKSHYTIFKRRLGFQWLKDNVCVYEVEGVSGKVFGFDLETGVITERTTEQVAPRLTDAEAIEIASRELSKKYSAYFEKCKPYHAKLAKGKWHVYGTVPGGCPGGTPEAHVRDADGAVIGAFLSQ